MFNPNPNCQIGNSTIGWTPPPIGSWKLNCDGSVRRNGREAGCGGILRDSSGNFVFGFTSKLQSCSVVEAELWGIFHGTSIACSRGFNNLIVETDSFEAAQLLLNNGVGNALGSNVALDILKVGDGSLNCEWVAIDRDMNAAADTLAKVSHSIDDPFVIYNFIPDMMAN